MGYIDLSDRKPFAGAAEVEGLGISLFAENDQIDQELGPIEGVVLHWSAGPYTAVFNAYHYCLVWDTASGQMHVAKTLKLAQLGQHAYRFNHHRIGISWMAMRSCVPGDFGPCPITPAFLDAGARFVAEFTAWHQLDPDREFNLSAGGPWPALLDHDQVDQIVGRNEKWDLRPYRAELFAAVRSHFAALKAGHQEFVYKGILTDAVPGEGTGS